jgi:hypothetical protein
VLADDTFAGDVYTFAGVWNGTTYTGSWTGPTSVDPTGGIGSAVADIPGDTEVSCTAADICAESNPEGNVATLALAALQVTTTSVTCGSTSVGKAATCTATVSDASGGTSVPTGTVNLTSSPTSGTFASSGSCTLSPTSATFSAACSLAFTPSAAGSYVVSGNYSGDAAHYPSGGTSAAITVSSLGGGSPPTPKPKPPAPGSVSAPAAVTSSGQVTLTLTNTNAFSVGYDVQLLATSSELKTVMMGDRKKSSKPVTIASKRVTVAAHKKLAMKLKLSKAALKQLKRHHSLKVTLKLSETASGHPAAAYSRTITLKLKK